jgi:hypothetical protein
MGARESVNDFLNVPGSSFSFFHLFSPLPYYWRERRENSNHTLYARNNYFLFAGDIEIND